MSIWLCSQDSTGIPHILEHSVLCGSRKYNVKDPFVQLAKGSLNTFLNAFTYPDRTCYPVASTNLQVGQEARHRSGQCGTKQTCTNGEGGEFGKIAIS